MKIETKEVYKCDFCNKLYQIKRFAESHEKSCGKNPNNIRPCFECNHLEKKETTIYHDTCYGEDSQNVSLLYCSKIKSFLYPPKVEHKGNCFELGDEANSSMPKVCEKQDNPLVNVDLPFI